MDYILDTVVLIRHFTGHGKIGNEASRILCSVEQSDDSFFISIVSLMEIMYLAEKNRIAIGLEEAFSLIESSTKYRIVDLSPSILKVAETVEFSELHDRLILATAKWLGVEILSSDREFQNVQGIQVIWN